MTDIQARPSQTTVQIRCTQDGPYAVAGDITLTDHAGRPIELPDDGTTVHLCRCGGSGNKPFCDGTHAIEGFDGTLVN
jgi:CDGSH-type Zn-finger protein